MENSCIIQAPNHTTFFKLVSEGTLYMVSIRIFSSIDLKPLAPVFLFIAFTRELFLSIIEPNQWDLEFKGSFRLNSDKMWEKVEVISKNEE